MNIRATDVRPSPALDLVIDHLVYGQVRHDRKPPRYSRYLPAALRLADFNHGFSLIAHCADQGNGWACLQGWMCVVRYWDKDGGECIGRGEDERPTMAICKAILKLYAVEIIE